MQTGFIAAIDLGTFEIKGVVGRTNENNVISIMESEVITSDQSIRRGLVYNIEKTGALVRKMVTLLENKLGKKIGRIYVSVSGQSIHTEDYNVGEQLTSSEIVTDNVIHQLRQKADKYVPKDYKLYSIADVEYFVLR
jgi:cell division protein FtsA